MVGLFINVLPMRIHVSPEDALLPWLKRLQEMQVEIGQYEYCPLGRIRSWSEVPPEMPLFESILDFVNYPVSVSTQKLGDSLENTGSIERVSFPLSVLAVPGSALKLEITYEGHRFDAPAVTQMLRHLQTLLESMVNHLDGRISDLSR